MKYVYLLIILVLMQVGCAQPQLNTLSGKPEVTLAATNRDAAESKVTDFFVNSGYTAKAPDRMNLRFERAGDFALNVFFSSNYDSTAFYRIDVTILQASEGYFRVVASPYAVTNRGSAFERETPLTGQSYLNVQAFLEEMAEGAAKAYDPKLHQPPATKGS